MIGFIISAIKIVFLLGFLIFIHEGGHFLIAKLCKVKVNEFAIGFGPTIWRKQGKETKYAIRLIPLGGFVSMEGEEERADTEGSFSKASIPRRMAIVAAGGIVNIIFGLCVYFILVSFQTTNISNKVDSLVDGYSAQIAGIQQGDEIQKINGKKIRLKSDLDNVVEQSKGEELTLEIKRNNQIENIKLKPTEVKQKSTGIYLSGTATGKSATEIIKIEEGSSAQKQGLEVGDIILKINTIQVEGNQQKVIELIGNSETENLEMIVERNKEEKQITLVPDEIPVYYLGVTMQQAESNIRNNIYYGFWKTTDFAASILDNLKMLFTGKVGVDQMMGPVGISNMVSKTQDLEQFIYMLALISLSLGVTNLLPIPALDGGKLLLLIIEAIRRKPLKEELEIGIQSLGFAILIALSIFITYKDVLRIFK